MQFPSQGLCTPVFFNHNECYLRMTMIYLPVMQSKSRITFFPTCKTTESSLDIDRYRPGAPFSAFRHRIHINIYGIALDIATGVFCDPGTDALDINL